MFDKKVMILIFLVVLSFILVIDASAKMTGKNLDTTPVLKNFDKIHLSYIDSIMGKYYLKYAKSDGEKIKNREIVDTLDTNGLYVNIFLDHNNNPNIVYFDFLYLKIATYVGSNGTGCTNSAWNCETIDKMSFSMSLTSAFFQKDGNDYALRVVYVGDGDLKIATYVGSNGTGCTNSAWTCKIITESVGSVYEISGDISVNFEDDLEIYFRAKNFINGTDELIRAIEVYGDGCTNKAWNCDVIYSRNVGGFFPNTLTGGEANANSRNYLSFYDANYIYSASSVNGYNDVYLANYVGSNGSCGGNGEYDCQLFFTEMMVNNTLFTPLDIDILEINSKESVILFSMYSNNNPFLRKTEIATYVDLNGNCGNGKWKCRNFDSGGSYGSLGMIDEDNIYYFYQDITPNFEYKVKLAQGFFGNGNCGDGDHWRCIIVDSEGMDQSYPSMAIESN